MAAEKKTQILQLDPPSELVFKGPFNEIITSNLSLQNPSNRTVLFKVKTTAPKQYCVRPNSGVLDPGNIQTIAVMLQPSDIPLVDKSKHKFMVQSMFAPVDFNVDNLDQMWKAAPKSELMDSKLKCSFIEDQDSLPADKPAAPSACVESAVAAADSVEAVTTTSSKEDLCKSASSGNYQLPPEEHQEPVQQPVTISVSQPTAGSTPAHLPAPKETEQEIAQREAIIRTMQDKMDQLANENRELKSEVAKIRHQKSAPSEPISLAAPSLPPSSPLNIIAILLILVALVLGYFVGQWF